MHRAPMLDPEPLSRQLRERLLTLELATVPATLLDCLRALFPFDRAQVMLLEDGLRLSVRAHFDGDRVVPLPAGERPELDAAGHPVLREALSGGAAVVVPDTCAHPGWTLPAEPTAEVSWMGVPQFARGEVAGLLEHRGDRVMVVVEDDGVGFEPDRVQSGERFGLLGLRERAEALDGTLTVESAPGAGTTVVMEVASADPHSDR